MFTKLEFAKKLKELREKKGYNYKQLADELGISSASLGYYERGERVPDIELLSKLCDYFNVSADYMLGISDVSSVDVEDKAICERIGINERTFQALLSLFEKSESLIEPELLIDNDLSENNVMQSFICGINAPLFRAMLSFYVRYKELCDNKKKDVDKASELISELYQKLETDNSVEYKEFENTMHTVSELQKGYLELEDKCNAAEYRLNKHFIVLLDNTMNEWYGYFKSNNTTDIDNE